MKVRVTRDDLRKGKPRSSDQCPVALALRRYGLSSVTVGINGFRQVYWGIQIPAKQQTGNSNSTRWFITATTGVCANLMWRVVKFPPHVTKNISLFDAGAKTGPFSFEVPDLPS